MLNIVMQLISIVRVGFKWACPHSISRGFHLISRGLKYTVEVLDFFDFYGNHPPAHIKGMYIHTIKLTNGPRYNKVLFNMASNTLRARQTCEPLKCSLCSTCKPSCELAIAWSNKSSLQFV